MLPMQSDPALAMQMAGVVLLAMLIDKCLGEPRAKLHPVVWLGAYLRIAGRVALELAVTNAGKFLTGVLAWLLGAAVVTFVAFGLQMLSAKLAWWLQVPLMAVMLKPMLSWRMLREEILGVEEALSVSLQCGRERLAHLVSRDVDSLDECSVRESAIESLAENLNDSVVAPLFWFALLGLPGAALYRFSNTADAMWGYRGKWEWAGKFAARCDDVMSWIPARITALLLIIVTMTSPENLRHEARKTPSPNSGWPMAAMANAIGVRLGKPGVYLLNPNGRSPMANDTRMAAVISGRAVSAAVILMFVSMLATMLIRGVF